MKMSTIRPAWTLVTLILTGLTLSACVTVNTGSPLQNPPSAATISAAAPTAIAPVPATTVPTLTEQPPTAIPPTALPEPTDMPTVLPPTDTVTPAPTDTPLPLPTDTPMPPPTAVDKAPSTKGTGRGGTPVPVEQPTDTPVPGGAGEKGTGRGGTPAAEQPTATPAPHTRTLYSDVLLIGAKLLPVFGGKADAPVNRGNVLPVGCEIVDVKGLDYHWTKPSGPPAASVDHGDHGYTVSRLGNDPRDLGTNMHLWYNAPSNIWVRVAYTVRENWDVDCNIAGWTQADP